MLIYSKSRFGIIESNESELHKDFFNFCACHMEDMSGLYKHENYIGNRKIETFCTDDRADFEIETVYYYEYTETFWTCSDSDYRKHFKNTVKRD